MENRGAKVSILNEIEAKLLLIQAQNKDPYDKIKAKLLSGIPTVEKAIESIKEDKRVKALHLLQYWKDYHQEHKEYRKREYRKNNPFKSIQHELQGSNRDTYQIDEHESRIKKVTTTRINGKIQ